MQHWREVLLSISTYGVFCLNVYVSNVVSIVQNSTIFEDVSLLGVAV